LFVQVEVLQYEVDSRQREINDFKGQFDSMTAAHQKTVSLVMVVGEEHLMFWEERTKD